MIIFLFSWSLLVWFLVQLWALLIQWTTESSTIFRLLSSVAVSIASLFVGKLKYKKIKPQNGLMSKLFLPYRVSHKNVYIFLVFFSKTHRHQILKKTIDLIEHVIKIKFWCFLTWLNDCEKNYRLTASEKSHYRLVYIFFQNPFQIKWLLTKW